MRQLSLHVDDQPALPLSSGMSPKQRSAAGKGSLTEIITCEDSAIQPMQLLPMLAQCDSSNRWLMWLSPNRTLNKQWLESIGLQKAPVVHIDLCCDTQNRLCERILGSGNSHLIIEWQGTLNKSERDKLRKLAGDSGSHVVLIHQSR